MPSPPPRGKFFLDSSPCQCVSYRITWHLLSCRDDEAIKKIHLGFQDVQSTFIWGLLKILMSSTNIKRHVKLLIGKSILLYYAYFIIVEIKNWLIIFNMVEGDGYISSKWVCLKFCSNPHFTSWNYCKRLNYTQQYLSKSSFCLTNFPLTNNNFTKFPGLGLLAHPTLCLGPWTVAPPVLWLKDHGMLTCLSPPDNGLLTRSSPTPGPWTVGLSLSPLLTRPLTADRACRLYRLFESVWV